MAFKIAYCAGHGLNTAGKRLPKYLDAAQTREWTLNDRIAYHFLRAALLYEDVETMRTDDSTGRTDIAIKKRVEAAEDWNADFYLDIHHNAGIYGGTGGGVVAFSYPGNSQGKSYRDAAYDAVIAAGGLKGNRSSPRQEKNYETLRRCHKAGIPAILMEYGFMDSRTDAPVILTEAYAILVAYATMAGIAKVAKLKRKDAELSNKKEECTVNVEVLKKGSKGDTVRAMQILLAGNGYQMEYNGKVYGVDSSFGNATENALKAYQADHGLSPDGSCGPKTWAKLLGTN